MNDKGNEAAAPARQPAGLRFMSWQQASPSLQTMLADHTVTTPEQRDAIACAIRTVRSLLAQLMPRDGKK